MASGFVLESFATFSNLSNDYRNWSTSSSSLPSASLVFKPRFPHSTVNLSMSFPRNRSLQRRSESVSLCTDPEGVDVAELSTLLAATQLNCEQFPAFLCDRSIVPVNLVKLRRALSHSTVVVALYLEGQETFVESVGRLSEKLGGGGGGGGRSWLDWKPRPPRKRTLVAFGRATSDHSLTASIYDLAVTPCYQRSGYGSLVLLRIVRELRRFGISDIAATFSPQLRPFFQHCGFKPDTLQSVTMMYTRSASSTSESWQIKEYGRKSLLIPSPLKVLKSEGQQSYLL